ncbi:hypothetical protein ERJ70_01355 [Sediminibacillus dalangtanensis]|uniref:YesK-like protein n=1 Tax=Sediminibacillus dalangtanensis TaxID=2729421 RepID=A0ABX7VR79_9BACI|nr:hypothetical protein [Sediminibacillus dalangtanensis]QTM98085.1 hypothetical protein ERJ70_01355 [Sediminibacillus dalangtanensis]
MSTLFLLLLFILSLVYLAVKHRKTIRRLHPLVTGGIAILFVMAAAVAFVCFYYGGQWLAGNVDNIFALVILQFVLLFVLIGLCLGILTIILDRMENLENSKRHLR